MDLLTSIILGIVQGVTEFLPVSSSGHISILAMLFGEENNVMQMAVFLHLGTLIALILYLKSDLKKVLIETIRLCMELHQNFKLWRQAQKTGEEVTYPKLVRTNYRMLTVMILVSTPVTAIVGALLRHLAYYVSRSGLYVGAAFFITAIILMVTDMVEPKNVIPKDIPLWKALIVGFAQGLSVIPGISRAGMTITAASMIGLNRKTAVRYSYLLSIPAIIGGLIVELHSAYVVGTLNIEFFEGALLGTAVSAAVAYFTVGIFLKRIRKTKFRYFAIYSAIIGICAIAINFL